MSAAYPDPMQMIAMRAYAAAAGDNWKARLRIDWMRGGTQVVDLDTYTLLHQLRNTHGGAWLTAFDIEDRPHDYALTRIISGATLSADQLAKFKRLWAEMKLQSGPWKKVEFSDEEPSP